MMMTIVLIKEMYKHLGSLSFKRKYVKLYYLRDLEI